VSNDQKMVIYLHYSVMQKYLMNSNKMRIKKSSIEL